MALIHKQPVNFIARTLLRPFRRLIPDRFHFAIDGTLHLRLTEGKKMLLHANPTSNLLRVLYWGGIEAFEHKEYRIFVHLIKRSAVFLDIGSNIGYYSLVAKKFNPSAEIHAFEPLPSANKYLRINAGINSFPDIHIHSLALTDFKGEAEFHSNRNPRFPELEDHLFGDNSLNREATGNFSRVSFRVKTETLDGFSDQYLRDRKADLIKMDTEGTEHLVLKGGTKVLSEHRPIIMCEVIKGFTEKEVANVLKPHNYLFYLVSEKGLIPVEELVVDKGKNDYFFVPKEKEDLVRDLLATAV